MQVSAKTEEPRDITFCTYIILQSELLVVEDTLADERFFGNPFVIGDACIRFYADAPITNPDGFVLGTLCVLDHVPRELSLEQQEALRILAHQVVTQLELRRNLEVLEQNIVERKKSEEQLQHNAFHDRLTNLPNRALFMDRLGWAIAQAKRYRDSFAEETGAIVPIGYWVLRQACHQIRRWQLRFPEKPLTISVNLSSKQLSSPELVEQISQILQETGLDPSSLKLEITESAIIENSAAVTTISQLRDLNMELHMDDFGTGYSSLSYLHRFPVNALKIDRSFVNRLDVSGEKAEIVRTILTLAHNLGIDAIAEGVETAKQLAQLKELQCQYGQGYFFSKPVDSKAAEAIIAQDLQW